MFIYFFFFNDTATTEIYTLSLHDALPIYIRTKDEFRGFELQFEWKLLKNGNSGVKYLIEKVDEWTNAAGRQARARGLEYQLADDANADAASDPRRVAGSLYSVIAPLPRIPPKIGAFK